MANNFYELKDRYQASYILEKLIANFADFKDVLDKAQADLAAIKAEESKTNSSIAN